MRTIKLTVVYDEDNEDHRALVERVRECDVATVTGGAQDDDVTTLLLHTPVTGTKDGG